LVDDREQVLAQGSVLSPLLQINVHTGESKVAEQATAFPQSWITAGRGIPLRDHLGT
jgi:hypothetical protein